MKNQRLFSILAILSICIPNLFSQNSLVKDESIYIYHFMKEIEWPIDYRNGDFVIQVYGSNRLTDELKSYTIGKTVSTQPIIVKGADKLEEIEKCQIIFVSNERVNELSAIKKKILNNRTLVITDKKEGVLDGAGISFVVMNGRLQYEISTDNIVKMGLKYSSDLVDLAVDIPIARHN
jgi:hypothetical protein